MKTSQIGVVSKFMFISLLTEVAYTRDRHDNKPVLGFSGIKYLLTGHEYSTNCTLPEFCTTSPCDVSLLQIVHCVGSASCNGVIQNTSITIDNKTIILSINEVKASDTGTYFCQYNGTSQDSFNLWVMDLPTGPVNISCISNKLDDLKCSWVKSDKDRDSLFDVRYRSYFIGSPMFGQFGCPHPDPKPISEEHRDDRGCFIASSTEKEEYTFVEFNNYTLYIEATNKAGSFLTKYPIELAKIVKLPPPIINITTGSQDVYLYLTFDQRHRLVLIEDVKYEIYYSAQGLNKTIYFNARGNTFRTTIMDLIPYVEYAFYVRIKSLFAEGDAYWSDTSVGHCMTLPAQPVTVPKIYGYLTHKDAIVLYIEPIHETDKYSRRASYRITIKSCGSKQESINFPWNTTTIHNITASSNCQQTVEIKTVNDVGVSSEFSKIVIPSFKKDRSIPKHVILEGSLDEFFLSWSSTGSLNNLNKTVIFWCVGSGNRCKSDQNSTEVHPSSTNTSVHTIKAEKWIFAVYFVYEDGSSTEMVFSECQFQSLNQEPNGVAEFSISPYATELQITTGDFCSTKYHSRPLTYTVIYKEKAGQNFTACNSNFYNRSIYASPDQEKIYLLNLKSDTVYVVCLSVTTRGGYRVTSRPFIQKTLQYTEDSWKYKLWIVIGVTVTSLIVLLISLCVCRLRNRYKEMDTDIDMPKITIHKQNGNQNGTLRDSGFPSSRSSDGSPSDNNGVQKGLDMTISYEKVNTISEEWSADITDTEDTNKQIQSHTRTAIGPPRPLPAIPILAEKLRLTRTGSDISDIRRGSDVCDTSRKGSDVSDISDYTDVAQNFDSYGYEQNSSSGESAEKKSFHKECSYSDQIIHSNSNSSINKLRSLIDKSQASETQQDCSDMTSYSKLTNSNSQKDGSV